ncbi:MFS transporter [Geomesophilobacter sediminis]|uniref:MFS transporter n=1 Tax=Geomesophilobacter sediminis TaxID=2798584 RepID=A0A8J7JGD9_9BACT|nr:MFS transporter [Geomesophilobacter sediminis]MBJ6725769.1 MFS transporter [Geomesophilobacter sediminis]
MAHVNLSALQTLLRALRGRNYRLYCAGQGISLVGTWMQQVAMSWLVYRMTGSAYLLGVVGFASRAPTFLLAPFAGVLADRWNRHHLLMLTQALAMLQAALLAAAVLYGVIQVWHIVVLCLLLGAITALEIPARQTLVVELVDREHLGNAIALNSSMVHISQLIGPAVAGMLVASVGEGVCFILNGASYLAVLLALAAMRLPPSPHLKSPRRRVLQELRDGVTYSFGFRPIRNLLLLIALLSLVGTPYSVLLPVFAKELLHGDAHTFGFMMTAGAGGALAGTAYLASRKSVLGHPGLIVVSGVSFALGIGAFALSTNIVLSLASLTLAGFGIMTLAATSNTVLQTILEEDKRGRVMSLYATAWMVFPFGSYLVGVLADLIGPRWTILLGAACCLVGTFLFGRYLPRMRAQVHTIYLKMGIIKDPA